MIGKLLGRELLVQNKCQISVINCLLFVLTKSGLEQLVEHLTTKQEVMGSIPGASTILGVLK